MSTKREPLLSDVQMKEMQRLSYTSSGAELANDVRNLYEAARAKDAEEIAKWKSIVKGVHGALNDIGTVPVPQMDADLYDAVMSIRAKDAELVDFILKKWREELEGDGWETSENYEAALEAAGFKPSDE